MRPAFRRWLLLTVASSIAVGAVAASFDREELTCPFGICGVSTQRGLRTQLLVTSANIRRLASGYRDAADLALAARVMPRGRQAGTPDVWFAPDVRDAARRSVGAALDADATSRGSWHGRGRVGVMVISDTTADIAGRPNNHSSAPIDVRAILPSPETDGRCVAVIRLRGPALTDGVKWAPARPLLDACEFFDAFGEPGAALRATLDSGAFSAARLYLQTAPDSARRQRHANAIVAFVNETDTDVVRCSAGQLDVCDSIVLAGLSRRSTRPFIYWYWSRLEPATRLPITDEREGWFAGALMDAIAADLGPDQFARFWRSPKPPAEAYREVAGRRIGMVAYEQMRSGARFLAQPTSGFGLRSETTLPATLGSSALVLLAIAALVGLAVRASRRPTVA